MKNLPEFQEAMERAKELECLYQIEEALNTEVFPDALMKISKVTQMCIRDRQYHVALFNYVKH